MTFEEDLQAYLTELDRDGVYSTSHRTLHYLYVRYGKLNVDTALDNHFNRPKEVTS